MDKEIERKEIGRTRSGLRYGWTTGSCAAAAAKAAAQMLFSGQEIRQVRLMTPKGIELYLDVESVTRMADCVRCAVRKYSGDDPDGRTSDICESGKKIRRYLRTARCPGGRRRRGARDAPRPGAAGRTGGDQ